MTPYIIDNSPLTSAEAYDIIAQHRPIALGPVAIECIERCRKYLDEKIASSDVPLYGITTGFGSLCNISIAPDDLSRLQSNLVKSHACGCGDTVDPDIVRLMMLLKVKSLAYGNSGVQTATVERLVEMYNADIIPVVYQQGSLGASGDLAPLANMCLPLIGLGQVWQQGRICPAAEVLAAHGMAPLTLMSKEGLALLNGTQFMSAHFVWGLVRARRLFDASLRIAAMSLEAYDGRIEPFGPQVNEVRHHRGQIAVAAAMRRLLEGSTIITRHKEHVQDPYSFRCIPQVHGAVLDTLSHAERVLTDEINSPTDNPTIFPDDDIIVSAGNFHGEPIALPMDFVAIALTELMNISERRLYKLISGTRGLPSFLVANPGLNSGFMITQYAAASIVNQSKGLCWPTSCDTIPSSQGQEDHVSMGANSATKLLRVAANLSRVLAIELFAAAQALDFRRSADAADGLHSSPAVEADYATFRSTVPFVGNDTEMYCLIDRSVKFVDSLC